MKLKHNYLQRKSMSDKQVLFLSKGVFPKAIKFAKAISGDGLNCVKAQYSELEFQISGSNGVKIYLTRNVNPLDESAPPKYEFIDIEQFQTIVVVSTHTQAELQKTHVLGALALFARTHGIKLIDATFEYNSGKLYEIVNYALNGINVQDTAYGSLPFLARVFSEDYGEKAVLKDVFGERGSHNYLINSVEELAETIRKNPNIQFVMQKYIPNDGDYRVVCLDGKAKMVIHWDHNVAGHKFRTRKNGPAKLIPLGKADPSVVYLAEKAAKVAGIDYAGVDIMENRDTRKPYVIEVNRTPQICTGSFIEEKEKMMREFLLFSE